MTSGKETTTGVDVYFAYATKDKTLQEELEMQLGVAKRTGYIRSWHRFQVSPGTAWRREIDTHLQNADVILLLISPYFINSDFCWNVEMEQALKRHEAGDTCIIPIIIRHTANWEEAPFGKLQALPRDKRPVDAWKNRFLILEQIANEILTAIETFRLHQSHKKRYVVPELHFHVQQRSEIVMRVYERLLQPDTTLLALTGKSGVGKTTLANLLYRFAKQQLEAGKGPFREEPIWIAINPSFTMDDLVKMLFDALTRPYPNVAGLTPQEQAHILFHALDTVEKPRLIILDQFEHFLAAQTGEVSPDHPGIHAWLALLNQRPCACRVLITSLLHPNITDRQDRQPQRVQNFPVPGLEGEEGVAFLRKSLQVYGIKTPEKELQIAYQRSQGHPFLLSLLVSLLGGREDPHVASLLDDLHDDPLRAEAKAEELLTIMYQQQLDHVQRHALLALSIFRKPASSEAVGAVMKTFTRAPVPHEQLLPAIQALRNRHLLEEAPSSRYQLHPIVVSFAHHHFDGAGEQASSGTLLAAHAKAAEFYQRQAEKTCPPRKQRESLHDFHDFGEAVWHWCQAKRPDTAYALICKEELFAGLQRCGSNAILFELYNMLLPLETWKPASSQSAQIYNEYGEIQRTLGQKQEAENSFMRALSLFQELRDLEGQVKTLNNLGAVRRNLGLLERALSCYQQALHICDRMETPYLNGKATALNNRGVIAFYLGQKEQALKFFEQALLIQRVTKDQSEEARTLMNIGKVYDAQKRGGSAYHKYLEALRIFQEIGDREGLAEVYNQLGMYYAKKPEKTSNRKLKRRQEAGEYHIAALSIFQEIGDREQAALTLQRLGRLVFYFYAIDNDSHKKEDFREPLAFYVYARQIFTELQSPEKGEITKLVMDELQSRLGAEQLAGLIAEIEPHARQIVEQVLRRGYLLPSAHYSM
jgi:tetratricopeptide (TPR) repeat protein